MQTLSVCLCLSLCLSLSLSLSLCLSVSVSLSLCLCLSVSLCLCLSLSLSVSVSVSVSLCLCLCLSVSVSFLELLDKLQKRITGLLILFYRYCFGRCSCKLAQLVPLPFSRGKSTRYSDRLHVIFLSPVLDVKSMSMSTVFFLAQLDSEILCI